ncbi:MAG: amidohydrolase family protein, partial [Alphaproteobacteria bacterium]
MARSETGSKEAGDRRTCDIIVENGCVITLDEKRTIYAKGAVAIKGRTIAAVGPERQVLAEWRAPRTIDARGAPVHPGFIDPHNHVVHITARGVFVDTLASAKQPVSFADWKADVRPEEEHVGAQLSCLELLRNGFTMFVEPGTAFDNDAIAEAAQAVGVRGMVTEPYLWDSTDIFKHAGGLYSEKLLARCPPQTNHCLKLLGRELKRNKDPDALVRGYIGLYGEGTASDELERAAKAKAREAGVVFQQHEGYLPTIAKLQRERFGKSRMSHLAGLGVIDRDTTFIHMYCLYDEDEKTLLDAGASIIWCPHAYLTLNIHGQAKVRMMGLHRRGLNVALATDGSLDNRIGVAGPTAHYVARDAGDALSAEAILEMQTIAAARVSGLGGAVGSLEAGKRADLVVRSDDATETQPGLHPVHQLALVAGPGTVDTVIVDG